MSPYRKRPPPLPPAVFFFCSGCGCHYFREDGVCPAHGSPEPPVAKDAKRNVFGEVLPEKVSAE